MGGGGSLKECFSSQDVAYGGWEGWKSNKGRVVNVHEGKAWISIPEQCTLVFVDYPWEVDAGAGAGAGAGAAAGARA